MMLYYFFRIGIIFGVILLSAQGKLYADYVCSVDSAQVSRTVPVYILASQSNANLAGMDPIIVNAINASSGAAEFLKVAVNGTSLNAVPDRLDWDPDTDYINAGPGRDTMLGGPGADRFTFATGQFAGSTLSASDFILQ